MSQLNDNDYIPVFIYSHGTYDLGAPPDKTMRSIETPELGYFAPQWDVNNKLTWREHGVYSGRDWFTDIPDNMVVMDPVPVSFQCSSSVYKDIVFSYVICNIGLSAFMNYSKSILIPIIRTSVRSITSDKWRNFLKSKGVNPDHVPEIHTYIRQHSEKFINSIANYKDSMVYSYAGKGKENGKSFPDYGNIRLSFENTGFHADSYTEHFENFSDIKMCNDYGFAEQPSIIKPAVDFLQEIALNQGGILLSSLLILLQHYQTREKGPNNPFYHKKLAIILISCRPAPGLSLSERNYEIEELYDNIKKCFENYKNLIHQDVELCARQNNRLIKIFADADYFFDSFNYIYDFFKIRLLEEEFESAPAYRTISRKTNADLTEDGVNDMYIQFKNTMNAKKKYDLLLSQHKLSRFEMAKDELKTYITPPTYLSGIIKLRTNVRNAWVKFRNKKGGAIKKRRKYNKIKKSQKRMKKSRKMNKRRRCSRKK